MFTKIRKRSQFSIINVASFKISNPDSVRVKTIFHLLARVSFLFFSLSNFFFQFSLSELIRSRQCWSVERTPIVVALNVIASPEKKYIFLKAKNKKYAGQNSRDKKFEYTKMTYCWKSANFLWLMSRIVRYMSNKKPLIFFCSF